MRGRVRPRALGVASVAVALWLVLALVLAAPAARAWNQTTTTGDEEGLPLAWNTSCVYWTMVEQEVDNSHFSNPVQPLLSFEDLQTAVRGAFLVWEEVDCSYFRFLETPPGHCLDIGYHNDAGNANRVFLRSSGWVDPNSPWREPGQIALTSVFYDTETGEIFDVDIEVNAEYFELTTTLEDPQTDIQNALAHEVGHLLGLDHSEFSDATMYWTAREHELSKRDLSPDDIEGLCAIYPILQDPDRCREPRGGLDIDCETADWCAEPVEGLVQECAYNEQVCCCEHPGGLGVCGWSQGSSCRRSGGNIVLQIDQDLACGEDRPSRNHLCCCHTEPLGGDSESLFTTTCSWELVCQRPETEAALNVNAEVLCGARPETKDCGCSAPRPRPAGGLARLLLGWLL